MARKSIKGYAEKNYYDNTRFSGGIVATNDPLNEGYFKSLVNFDISDTGYSLQPRKGFFTTLLNAEDSDTGRFSKYALNSRRTIYFYNASSGHYIFIDFSQTIPIKKDNEDVSIPVIIEAELNIEDKFLSAATLIKNIEYPEDLDLFSIDMYSFNNRAEQVLDQYNITKYIIKIPGVKNTENNSYYTNWFLLTFRAYGTTYNDITYEANTLIIEPLDFSDTVSIEMKDRNIASSKSIIPDPFQKIYSYNDVKPDGFVQSFPIIYIYDSNKEKYLLNTTNNVKDIVIRPHYTLDYPRTGDYWAYTYDIISSKKTNEFLLDLPSGTYLDESGVYKSPIYTIDDTLNGNYTSILHKETWFNLYSTHVEDRLRSSINIKDTLSLDYYGEYLKSLSFREGTQNNSYLSASDESKSTLVIYIMPSFKDKNYKGNSMVVQPITNSTDLYDIFNNKEGKSIYLRDGSSNIGHGSVNYNYIGNIPNVHSNLSKTLKNLDNVDDIINLLEKYLPVPGSSSARVYTDDYMFYVKPLSDITELFMNSKVGVMAGTDTFLCNRVCAFPSKGYDFADLCTYLRKSNFSSFIFKLYTNTFALEFSKDFDIDNNKQILDLFEGLDTKLNLVKNMKEEDLSKEENKIIYYVSTDVFKYETYDKSKYKGESTDIDFITDLYYRLFISSKVNSNNSIITHEEYIPLIEYNTTEFIHASDHTYDIPSTYWDRLLTKCKLSSANEDLSIFYKDEDTGLLQTSYEKILNIVGHDFLQEGIGINFYLFEIPNVYTDDPAYMFHYNRSYFVSSTSLKQSRQIIYSSTPPTTMIETLTEEPEDISSASNSLIFRSAQGDHLVLYKNNKLYMSEANKQYYFKYTKTFSYPEQIVKVIQYKDTLLVFTTQNLYSVYPIEVTENVESGVDAEGNKQYTQVTTIEYGSLPVLYNLLVDEKYKDAIQVYNQMVLFYSADGQMFMIKPTATIDSNTRFSIQYFNKNANDILLNYRDYIRERLKYYGYEITTELEGKLKYNINIKVSVSLNNIKIFYCVPGVMTYILVYDIINNRYYVYDTLSFTNVKHLEFIPEGELYIVEHNNQLYFTQPYVLPLQKNNNVDLSYFHGFTPEPILTELDTGIENLNNHLKKRFKDLHIIYKNISAESIEFSLDVFVDNVPISTYINPEIQVQNISSSPTYTVCSTYATKELINNNNVLFDFSQFNSSKILTHKTSIISRGKTIRTKLCFKSDGVYKIQGYGLIYKEHTV